MTLSNSYGKGGEHGHRGRGGDRKRKMGENIYSKKVSTQNRELELRYIAYNAKRVVKTDIHFLLCVRISTKQSILKKEIYSNPKL